MLWIIVSEESCALDRVVDADNCKVVNVDICDVES